MLCTLQHDDVCCLLFSVVVRLIGTVGQKSPLCGFPHTWVVGGTKLATLTTV